MANYGQGESSGKIILMGEHAVVYGEPAIAFPFYATKVTAQFETLTEDVTQDQLFSAYYVGKLIHAPQALKNIKALVTHLKQDHGVKESVSLTIESTIPAERGMGSSAAVAVAITRAFYDYLSLSLAHETLLSYVQISEKIAHGNPSGIDAAATSSHNPIYFIKGQPFEYFTINLDAFLIVADTGIKGQTREAVKDVAHLFEKDSHKTGQKIQQLGQLTQKAKQAIIQNNPENLAQVMNQAQVILRELTISNHFLDLLIETALDAGALGAKLTGGGRGGCMLALAKTKTEAQAICTALEDAGAVATWIQGLGVHTHV
ncbi:mevalonate kinase [Enterococcus thailandicus]|uniref:Mevalonate kinase n=1 Tax=Enterococcus thailandicus TaxID=417368 RepID=A0A179EQZ8_ENTTH|nr:mevalonate kinase [Enterococcus thailandicus]MDT2751478.1 mevalonate kinase [Enterococcus thailandicus]MDT2776395.1 mevalonate kinase [Enterococcus thailandicus]MDT2794896.1 mevalonate kinase [Enterococcus thailandicus]OAQ55668.1 mevalonate kinase [Enterococcus thailandicus]